MGPVTAQDGIQTASAIFHALISNRLAERYKAVELLNDPRYPVDFPTLKTLLIKAITKDYYVGKEVEQDDPAIASTRSWLLGMLARVSAGDGVATKLVIKHIDGKFETNDWARYWALEGLISGKNSETETVARRIANDNQLLVGMLATAFIASLNEPAATKKIKESLNDPEMQWSVLRALRVIALPATVPMLCEIVEKANYTDETYDAIVALGNIPGDWNHSTRAAQALSVFISKMRGSPWKDSMRTGTITSLGKLKIESTAPLIIEELTDDNPAIVREAARSIEKIIGLRLTVIRVVEAALQSGAAGVDIYARALRWLNRDAVAEELETLMTTGSAHQQDIARTLLSELGGTVAFEKLRVRTDAMKQYTDVLEETEKGIRSLFDASVREAQGGFQIAVIMDVVVFSLGILLLLGSAGYALFSTGDLSKWAGVGISGGLGVLGIVYGVLISNPRRQVRESVDHLMLVKIVFLSYLRRLHQADQAYTRRLLDDEPITVDQVKDFSDLISSIMDGTIQQQLKGFSQQQLKDASIASSAQQSQSE
jgi:hypothetical protein